MSEACHPQDVRRVLTRLALVHSQLDSAGLPAPSDQHLGLDDDWIADPVRSGEGILDGGDRLPLGHSQPVTGEQLLALILQQVHYGAVLYR